ncbi:MAG: fibronectin/fibrinogen-binding protein [Chloroflexi bacterium]|nr:fibronectin/fibrinogen-binding protein [Chloroflexota bacterium]
MYMDAVTIAALQAELDGQLSSGRVQNVVQLDDLTLGFEIYSRRQRNYLLMTAHPQDARVHLMPDRLRRGIDKPSPLLLHLKKYVDGARVESVTQPPWERILWIDFSSHEGDTRLVIEVMDKRSNIVLMVPGGNILDCIKRVGPNQNRYRVILPGKPYVAPPPQNKQAPQTATVPNIANCLHNDLDAPAWRMLVNSLAGVSPLLAREAVFYATGESETLAKATDSSLLHAAFHRIIDDVQAGRWQPCVVPAPQMEGYQAFAAYPLTHLGDWLAADSISDAIQTYFGAPVSVDAYAPAKSSVKDQLERALNRARRKMAALERQSADEEKIERLRKMGELVFAYSSTIQPKQTELRAQYDFDAPEMVISLDPDLSPTENGQRYFEKYEKAKRAAENIPALQEGARNEVDYLEQLAVDLALAENWPEIQIVREALQDAGYWEGKKTKGPKGGKPGIRRFATDDGYVVMVGRNAHQNHELITERSAREDLWLHARDIPGSHVIIKNDGRPIPEALILRAAALAAYYSKNRDESTVDVDVTERRYVRPIKGGRPGMVTYRNERTVNVRPSAKLETT